MIRHTLAEGWVLLRQRSGVSMILALSLAVPISLAGVGLALHLWLGPAAGKAGQESVVAVLLHPRLDPEARSQWIDREKTVHPDRSLSDLQVDFHHRFKRENGYNDLEISQKREALENVLVPETVPRHLDRLRRCGFSDVDIWLKWFNFCSWICIK